MHIVHIKQGYSSAADVAHMVDGLGVIGVFLKAQPGAQPNDQFQALFNAARDVTFKGKISYLKSFSFLLVYSTFFVLMFKKRK